jgi:enoyl-CoA hydratase/carnithine racemase
MTTTDSEVLVEWSVQDHIATVALNRPKVLNAITTDLLLRLIDVFDELSDDSSVWCVILKGNGRAFCVGADQKERPGMSLDDVRRRRRIAPRAFSAMRNCVHPVIAQVHGHALGGGLELALGCDLVVAAIDTSMGFVETKVGAIPGGGATQLLPRLIGPTRAKELIFTGRKFVAQDAVAWGLINYVVPSLQLESSVRGLAEEIAAAAPVAVAQAKSALNFALDLDVMSGMKVEAALYERIMHTRDRNEALNAYKDNRKAIFNGD